MATSRPTRSTPRFHILGVGAIGSLLAYYLRRDITDDVITLLQRTSVKTDTVTLESASGATQSIDGFEFESSSQEDGLPIQILFVAVKAYSAVSAIMPLAPRITSETTIVLLQNGPLGVYDQLLHKTLFCDPESRPFIVLASNTHGAWMRDRNKLHVVHAGKGVVEFGIMPNPRAGMPVSDAQVPVSDIQPQSLRETVGALLRVGGLDASWVPLSDLQVAMRRKLVVNAFINPLTAVMGCRNGEIFGPTSWPVSDILRGVCEEAAALFAEEARRNRTEFSEGVLGSEALEMECRRVGRVTAENISSMLGDVRAERRTEIEFLNGYLLERGKEYGLGMPTIWKLEQLIKKKEA